VEKVWGRGFGWGFGAIPRRAIVGGALAAPYYYGDPLTTMGTLLPRPPWPGYYRRGLRRQRPVTAPALPVLHPATGTFLGY